MTFQYDSADRRTQMTLPNGITVSYGYNAANQLTSLNYLKSDGSPLGNLTYGYDAAGSRISVGGSLANVVLPTSSSTGVYDANNRLTQFNGTAFTYDANGNTLTDATNTYTWDSRNRLVGIAGPTSASFQYDAHDRRTQKTVGSATTGYVYDGLISVQEQNSTGSLTAAVLSGGIDEFFARQTSAGSSTPITDALGSVVAETNSSEAIAANYSYDPYGATSFTGTASGNSQQYTGRENDGTGLYFYRARFYSPATGRFLSEDPVRLRSGQSNNYAYVGGRPAMFRDPRGLCATAGSASLCNAGNSGNDPNAPGPNGGDNASGGSPDSGDTGSDADNGKEPAANPDATGAGDRADRAVTNELTRQYLEQQAANDLAEGDTNAYNSDVAAAGHALDQYDSAVGAPPIATGGINPSVEDDNDPYEGDNPPVPQGPNPYAGTGTCGPLRLPCPP